MVRNRACNFKKQSLGPRYGLAYMDSSISLSTTPRNSQEEGYNLLFYYYFTPWLQMSLLVQK